MRHHIAVRMLSSSGKNPSPSTRWRQGTPSMRFVPVKGAERQAGALVLRTEPSPSPVSSPPRTGSHPRARIYRSVSASPNARITGFIR